MDDAAEVRVIEGAGDLHGDDRGDVDRKTRRDVEQVVEVDALHVLHHDEHRAALLHEVVHVQDVLVLQRRHEVRFTFKALREAGVDGDAWLQRLDRDGAAQGLLDGLVDDGHAA